MVVMRVKRLPVGKVLGATSGREWVQMFLTEQQDIAGSTGNSACLLHFTCSILSDFLIFLSSPFVHVLPTLDCIWFWFAAVVILQLTPNLTHGPVSKWQLPSVPWLGLLTDSYWLNSPFHLFNRQTARIIPRLSDNGEQKSHKLQMCLGNRSLG